MDRFLMKEVLTYPKPAEEADVLDRISSGAFEEAVPAEGTHGYVDRSVESLVRYSSTIEENYGLRPLASLVVALQDSEAVSSVGERVSFADLPGRVRDIVAPRVPGQERA